MRNPTHRSTKRIALALGLLLAVGAVTYALRDAPEQAPAEPSASEGAEAPGAGDEPEPADPPVLTGRVLTADTERGVPGARVALDGTDVAVTADDGSFRIESASEGTFTLTAAADGYVGPPPTSEPAQEVRIRPGLTVDGVTLALWPGASVAGRVVAAGRPIAGASLSLYYEAASGATEPFVLESSVTTDADGGFTLWPVHPGRLRVLAETKSYAMGESDERTVVAGSPATGLVIDLAASATLAGVVTDTQGQPIEGAHVTASGPQSARREATSGADGQFALSALSAGIVAVVASASGYETRAVANVELVPNDEVQLTIALERAPGFGGVVVSPRGEPVAQAVVTYMPEQAAAAHRTGRGIVGPRVITDDQGRFWVREQAERKIVLVATHREFAPSEEQVASPGDRKIVLTLRAGGALSGAVADAETRAPVTSYEVVIVSFQPRGERAQGGGGFERLRVADAEGRYRLPGLTPGTYGISVLANGYRAVQVDQIEVYAAQETRNVDVRLDRGGGLTGLVQDGATGEAIAGAAISISTLYEEGYRRGGPTIMTDASGRFRIEGLPPGPRSINVHARGYEGTISSGHAVPASGEQDIGVIRLARQEPGQRAVTRFSGIGTVLREQEGRIFTGSILDDGPAAAAGLEPGTEILAVDGQEISALSMSQVVERIRGQEGSDVRLLVLPPGAAYPEKLQLRRGQVTMRR